MGEYMKRSEHISREAAIESTWMILEGMGYPRSENRSLERTVEAVFQSAPAADVVEAVRCRDCVYWRGENDYCKGIGIDFSENGYCAFGERKDGGQDDGN